MANAKINLDQTLTLIVCGDRWNLEKTDPRDLLSHMISTVFDPRSPLEALKRSSQDLMNLLSEVWDESACLTIKPRRLWRNMCTKIRLKLKRIADADSRDQAVAMIYDCLLSLEGLGTLGGFSAQGSINLGTMNYNPERKSIMKRY